MTTNKRKTLNIGGFIEEVKADLPHPSDRATNPAASGNSGVSGIPGKTSQADANLGVPAGTTTADANPGVPTGTVATTVGRPARTQSLLSKKLSKLVYLDEATDQQLRLVKSLQHYDYKEVIFTAVREFLLRHYGPDMRLDSEGAALVESVIRDYKTRI